MRGQFVGEEKKARGGKEKSESKKKLEWEENTWKRKEKTGRSVWVEKEIKNAVIDENQLPYYQEKSYNYNAKPKNH